jgi:16S rRNA (guanine966-N2)-methyltransferase
VLAARRGERVLRVIAGRFGGRRLAVPAGRDVRPTAERVREALFSMLGALDGARVLDLYAGTGALGIEALSRGAASVVFVERAPASLLVLRANLEALGLRPDEAEVLREDVPAALRQLARAERSFELVLLDPPYAADEGARALQALAEARVLAPGARVVFERSRRHALPPIVGLRLIDERRYGDTTVSHLERDESDKKGR